MISFTSVYTFVTPINENMIFTVSNSLKHELLIEQASRKINLNENRQTIHGLSSILKIISFLIFNQEYFISLV